MSEFQNQKNLVRDLHKELDAATGNDVENVLSRYVATEYLWRGYHPFNELTSAKELAKVFWSPLKTAFFFEYFRYLLLIFLSLNIILYNLLRISSLSLY